MLLLIIILALCGGSNQLACGTAEPAEPHYAMQPVTNGITHEKPTEFLDGTKLTDSRDQMTDCQTDPDSDRDSGPDHNPVTLSENVRLLLGTIVFMLMPSVAMVIAVHFFHSRNCAANDPATLIAPSTVTHAVGMRANFAHDRLELLERVRSTHEVKPQG